MVAKFYHSTADPRKVDKSSELNLNKEILFDFKSDNSIFAPIIDVTENIIENNYVSIVSNDFVLYYFIDNIEVLSGGIYRVHLSCDVLMTYKNKILNTTQLVSRQEYKRSAYQTDSAIPIQSKKEIKTIQFKGGDLNIESASANTNNFVLMVAGASSSRGGE